MGYCISILLIFFVSLVHAQGQTTASRTLIVIFDGLRPEYVTSASMPNLYKLKSDGCYGTDHHSVFPTVTRVNASSYITGCYPAKHGLMGNTVYFPAVDETRGLNTGDFTQLVRIADATDGALLTAPSLGELLKRSGQRMMVFSSGSSGQAFLQNHTVNGGVVHPELILPTALQEDLLEAIGSAPPSAKPNTAQHEWVTNALMHSAFVPGGPLVSAIWFSDPDGTAHTAGIGSPPAVQSLEAVDRQLGRILDTLRHRKLSSHFNIIVTADHGFVTETGTETLTRFLMTSGLKKDSASDEVVLAGNAAYVKDHDPVMIRRMVALLQQQPWIGAVFTKGINSESMQGWVKGTLSFASIHWDHPARAADVLVDYNWSHDPNSFGYAGTSYAPGVAGHGGSSPYEVRIPFIAVGPSFRRAYKSSFPSSNVDIVPTILHIHGFAVPPDMDGRVLTELLENRSHQPETAPREIVEVTARHRWGKYRLTLQRSAAGKQRYVDFTVVERTFRKRRK